MSTDTWDRICGRICGPTNQTCCWPLIIMQLNQMNGNWSLLKIRTCTHAPKTVSATCLCQAKPHGPIFISDGGPLAQKVDPTSVQCRQMTARNARAPASTFAVSTPGNESEVCGEGDYHRTWDYLSTKDMCSHRSRAIGYARTLPSAFTLSKV